MRAVIAGCVLAILGHAGAVLAQAAPAPTPAPPVRQPVADPLRRIVLYAFAGEPSQWAAPPPDMIRRAAVQGDVAAWLSESDAPIAAWRQAPQSGQVTFKLAISPEGRVTACQPPSEAYGRQMQGAEGLCPPLMERARLVPALRADGRRMADEFIFTANFQYAPTVPNQPGPLVVSRSLSPAPPPSSDFDPNLRAWPPSANWLRVSASQPLFRQAVEKPDGTVISGPVIGLVAADRKSGAPDCRVVLSSGDAQADARACNHVRKKLKPKWADATPTRLRHWPLLLSAAGKGFRAIESDPALIRRMQAEAAEVERLTALWRSQAPTGKAMAMAGMIGEGGHPLGCRVYQSSGDDAADAAGCRLFRSEARFSPSRDAFGQPGRLQGWVNLVLQ